MGRQVNFVFDSVDAQVFFEEAQLKLDAVLIEEQVSSPEVVEIPQWRPCQANLCQRSDLSEIVPEYIEAQGYWLVTPSDGPVVEWMTWPEKEGVIGITRLFYHAQLYDSDLGVWVAQSEGFVRFAERLFRLLRRHAPMETIDERRERVGRHALKRIRLGELRYW